MEVFNLRASNQRHKKYAADVILRGKLYRNVNFGDKRYQHYKDSTPLRLYSHLDHNDLNRKAKFYQRHGSNNGPAALLSKEFLW